ncbi:MAG: lipid A export permease/ATP-binding protein MsbA [Magnetococcales bacterium]|nr:lipid A export permease/ATP-binding protein MsbA [Magnetococcales bacterium]
MSDTPQTSETPERPSMSNGELFRRFGKLVWPFRWYLLPALLAMIVMASTGGAIAFLVQPILDKVFIEKDAFMLYAMPAIILGIFVIRGIAFFIQAYLMEYVGQKVVRGLQIRLYHHFLAFDAGFILSQSTGALISRITYDANLLKEAASSVVSNILREGFSVIFLVGVLFYRDVEMALIALVGLPVAGWLIYIFGRKMRRLSRLRQELMEGVTAHLEETISGVRIVQSFRMESRERARFRRITKDVLSNHLKVAKVRSISKPAIDIISGVVVGGVVLFAGQAVINGTTTTGTFFSFITALLMAYAPIKRLTGLNNLLQNSLAAAQRIFELLDRKPAIANTSRALPLLPLHNAIRFENVRFRYSDDLPWVLDDISLTVRAGERVAVVGKSGSGKSSLINLVPRFFDVTEGKITLDNIDIRKATLHSLRSQIAMVTQEVILFNDTVRHNIAYGPGYWSQKDLENASEAANALEFINDFPEGFDTVVGDRGIRLSGGQRQRLSIARSILKDAPILILDEATSSLDTESERVVQDALDHLMEGRTTLVIAHRLSTIQSADRIVVLKEGRIVEEGTHSHLLSLNGEYARLHRMQFREET